MQMERREFFTAVAAPFLPVLLCAEARGESPELRNEAVWDKQANGDVFLRVGYHAENFPSPVYAVLSLLQGNKWIFRFCHQEESFVEVSEDRARKQSERLLVEWWRTCLVELERKAFRLE